MSVRGRGGLPKRDETGRAGELVHVPVPAEEDVVPDVVPGVVPGVVLDLVPDLVSDTAPDQVEAEPLPGPTKIPRKRLWRLDDPELGPIPSRDKINMLIEQKLAVIKIIMPALYSTTVAAEYQRVTKLAGSFWGRWTFIQGIPSIMRNEIGVEISVRTLVAHEMEFLTQCLGSWCKTWNEIVRLKVLAEVRQHFTGVSIRVRDKILIGDAEVFVSVPVRDAVAKKGP